MIKWIYSINILIIYCLSSQCTTYLIHVFIHILAMTGANCSGAGNRTPDHLISG